MAESYEYLAAPPPDGEWYARIVEVHPGAAGLRHALILVLTVGVSLVALNLYAPAHPSLAERVFASAILASVALPVWLWMCGVDRMIPFMPFVSLMFAYYFALPVFLLKRYATGLFRETIPEHYIMLALAYALIGMYCMFAGYYGPARSVFSPILPRFKMRWSNERIVRQVALVLGFGGLIASNLTARLPEQFMQVSAFTVDLSMIGICILVAMQLAGRLALSTTISLWAVLIPLRILLGFGAGATAPGLLLGAAIALTFGALRRVIPWKMLAIGTAALFILRPAQAPFRALTWEGGKMADASAFEKLKLFGDILYRITLGGAVRPESLIEVAGMRLAQFTVFGEVILDTPERVPYWNGESFYPMLFKPVPRFLMPEKPVEVSGQTFGHRYSLINQQNLTTSINLAQLIELYANFGLPGVIIGMFIFGLIYRLALEMYVHPGMGIGALVGGVYIASRMWDVGSATSLVLGAMPWAMVLLALINLVVHLAEIDADSLDMSASWSKPSSLN